MIRRGRRAGQDVSSEPHMDVTWPTTQLNHTFGALAPQVLAAAKTSGMTLTQFVLLVLAIGSLTLLMLSTRRRQRQKRHMPDTSIRERYAELKETNEATRGIEQAMLQLDQLSRQIHGRLDTKLAHLEALIRDADERIDALSRHSQVVEGKRALEITLDEERPEASLAPQSAGRHAVVHRLADEGLSPVDIAERTGRTTGEIELILALRKTVGMAPASGNVSAS